MTDRIVRKFDIINFPGTPEEIDRHFLGWQWYFHFGEFLPDYLLGKMDFKKFTLYNDIPTVATDRLSPKKTI
jgi:hypothetical protein